MPPIEKKKDPLDELPSGTKFNLEEWKRFYSNNDEDDSIKWFWEHFDAENYSIWRVRDFLLLAFLSFVLVAAPLQS